MGHQEYSAIPAQDDQPWDWWVGEGEKELWYDRFLVYLHMGTGRSLQGAIHLYQESVGRPLSRKPPGSWQAQFVRFSWKKRALDYDAALRKTKSAQLPGRIYTLREIKRTTQKILKAQELTQNFLQHSPTLKDDEGLARLFLQLLLSHAVLVERHNTLLRQAWYPNLPPFAYLLPQIMQDSTLTDDPTSR